MKSVLSATDRNELIHRIERLTTHNQAQWGKMSLLQMLKHCVVCEQMYLGDLQVKRSFIGRIFGPGALKKMLRDDTPLAKNSPTNPVFKVRAETGDLEEEKTKWISLIKKYESFSKPEFVHWFFGKMTKEQVGQFAYKHSDHHLRQFGG